MNNLVLLRITQDEYFKIPQDIRERHLSSKITKIEPDDWEEMRDNKEYQNQYSKYKIERLKLEEIKKLIREQNLNKPNNEK